jgi:hypothetical protein
MGFSICSCQSPLGGWNQIGRKEKDSSLGSNKGFPFYCSIF